MDMDIRCSMLIVNSYVAYCKNAGCARNPDYINLNMNYSNYPPLTLSEIRVMTSADASWQYRLKPIIILLDVIHFLLTIISD